MTQQTQISENLLESIEPPTISEDLLPVLSDVLQPPQAENGDESHS